MSMQRECIFYEEKPGVWYLFLATMERGSIGYTHTISVGPFASEGETEQYLSNNYSNPGGVTIYRITTPIIGSFTIDLYASLVKHAEKPKSYNRWE